MDAKRLQIIRIVTAAAIIFFVLLLTAMVVNLVKLATLKSREDALGAKVAKLDRLIEENRGEIDYRSTDEYVDKYAREYLNMIGKDEIAFKG